MGIVMTLGGKLFEGGYKDTCGSPAVEARRQPERDLAGG